MAVGAAYLATMKTAAGLTASLYDTQVTDLIEEARAEMVRVGIDATVAANESNKLVARAVRTHVCANFAESEQEATRLEASFVSQLSALALTEAYQATEETEDDEEAGDDEV